jgi:hypothetical protein
MLVPSNARPASKDATFLIPASDGYGIGECLDGTGDCGRLVADGWCAANGYSRAASYGPVSREDAASADSLRRSELTLGITCAE